MNKRIRKKKRKKFYKLLCESISKQLQNPIGYREAGKKILASFCLSDLARDDQGNLIVGRFWCEDVHVSSQMNEDDDKKIDVRITYE